MNLSFDSLIFDLDGTLWDTTGAVAGAWNSVLNNLGYTTISVTQSDVKAIAGTQHDKIFSTLFPNLNVQQCEELTNLCGQQELIFINKYGARLFDNAVEVLKSLSPSYPLFIVSNCQSGYIETFLDYFQLDKFFKDFECSGRTLKSKSENIKSIIKRNNLKAPVYIGDTQGDCNAAYGNQITFIYAAYGFGNADKFDLKIDNLNELIQLG